VISASGTRIAFGSEQRLCGHDGEVGAQWRAPNLL
jgi:hypothetical protein